MSVGRCWVVVPVEIVGAALGASRWLRDTSLLHHLARAPAAPVRWDSAAILVAIGLVAAAIGTEAVGDAWPPLDHPPAPMIDRIVAW